MGLGLFAEIFAAQGGGSYVCLRYLLVRGKLASASVTIEDGFGFEAVVPVKSPIQVFPLGSLLGTQRVFCFRAAVARRGGSRLTIGSGELFVLERLRSRKRYRSNSAN